MMEDFKSALSQGLNYLMSARVSDIADMLIVAFLLYKLIGLIRRTNTTRVAQGVIVVLLALWIADCLQLTVIYFVLSKTVELGLLALVILFQPELRRGLERVGSGYLLTFLKSNANTEAVDAAITQTVIAFNTMSTERTGALIVFERINSLDNQMNTGTIINSDTTAELLKNIFFKNAPLHDGAVIIRDGRMIAAGCMLPMSANPNLSRDLGMRHRAGIGMSEHSDAVVAIVSEETGAISVAVDGMLKRHLTSETFEKILRNELIADDKLEKPSFRQKIRKRFGGKGNE